MSTKRPSRFSSNRRRVKPVTPGRSPGAMVAAVWGCALLLAVGCTASTPERSTGERGRTHVSTSALRRPTRPPPVGVENSASGHSGHLIARAVRDLRQTRFWRPLTKHLYRVYLSARTGVVNIPDDQHLADALLTAAIDRKGSGALCDIRFYPAAISRDLVRQWRFFEDGRLARRPPTLRLFWTAVLAHELAHCLPHRNPMKQVGERVAQRWERRVVRAGAARASR